MAGGFRARLRHLAAAISPRASRGSAPLDVRWAGALHSRLTKGWNAYSQAADDAMLYQLPVLRARSRALCEDNGEAAGLLADFESDIVGPVGAKLQFRATKKRGTPLDALNDRIELQFTAWSQPEHCTLEGRDDLASLSRLMVRTVIMDGEFVAIRHRDPAFAHGYALQPIDADQVDCEYNVPRNAAGVAIVMGVEIDRYGKPLGYHVLEAHPAAGGRNVRVRYDARDVLHIFKRLRVGQTRGIPWFAPVIVAWKLGDQYTEAELVQSMLAAAQGGFFVNKQDNAMSASFPARTQKNPTTGKDEPVPIVLAVEPGVSRALPEGWEFQPWTPTHPTANYVGFMKSIKRTIGRAFSRSYATLTGDLSEVNFSSMRTDRVREMEHNKMMQADLLVRQFARVIFADWFTMASLMGKIGVLPPNMTPTDMLPFATWMCRGWPWIDPLKDAAAKKLELEMRITSPQMICAERGLDFYEIVDQIADAAEYAKSKGVGMDAVGLAITLDASDPDEKPAGAQGARGVITLAA